MTRFQIDDSPDLATLDEMIRDNTAPGVECEPGFLSWLQTAIPGDSYTVPIGGGWTVVRAVAAPAAPRIGQIVTVRGVECEIVRVRPFGTLDVVARDGSRAWRVSGLAFGEGA